MNKLARQHNEFYVFALQTTTTPINFMCNYNLTKHDFVEIISIRNRSNRNAVVTKLLSLSNFLKSNNNYLVLEALDT